VTSASLPAAFHFPASALPTQPNDPPTYGTSLKLQFHRSSFPHSILTRMLLTIYEEIGHVGRGCYKDPREDFGEDLQEDVHNKLCMSCLCSKLTFSREFSWGNRACRRGCYEETGPIECKLYSSILAGTVIRLAFVNITGREKVKLMNHHYVAYKCRVKVLSHVHISLSCLISSSAQITSVKWCAHSFRSHSMSTQNTSFQKRPIT